MAAILDSIEYQIPILGEMGNAPNLPNPTSFGHV